MGMESVYEDQLLKELELTNKMGGKKAYKMSLFATSGVDYPENADYVFLQMSCTKDDEVTLIDNLEYCLHDIAKERLFTKEDMTMEYEDDKFFKIPRRVFESDVIHFKSS